MNKLGSESEPDLDVDVDEDVEESAAVEVEEEDDDAKFFLTSIAAAAPAPRRPSRARPPIICAWRVSSAGNSLVRAVKQAVTKPKMSYHPFYV